MNKIVYITAFLSSSFLYANAQITVKAGTNVTISAGTSVTASGDVVIENTGKIENTGTLIFKGDLENFGNTRLDGTLIAEGSEIQSIGGTDSFSISDLRLNNSAGVKLTSKLNIALSLNLDKGVLFTDDAHPIYFGGHSSTPNETVDGYINGPAILDSRYIAGSSFNFLGAEVSNVSGDEIGMFGVMRVTGNDAVTAIGDETSISAKWEIYNESPTSGAQYNLKLSWLPAFDNGKDLTSLVLYGNTRQDSNKYIMLDKQSAYAITTNNMSELRTYTRNNIDDISRKFTIAGKTALSSTVPPVTITAFPNPATDHITFLIQNLESWVQDVTVKITDGNGKVFSQQTFVYNGNSITVNGLGFLPVGIYRAFISRGQLTRVVNFFKH